MPAIIDCPCVAIAAENVSQLFGGEGILPYHYFRLLRSRGVDVWLVAHGRTRRELLALLPNDVDHVCFVEDLKIQKFMFALSNLLPRRVGEATFGLANQLLTQFGQRRILRQLVRDAGVEVIHQPIPVSPRFPSLFWDLGAPLIIGPLNGGMEYPPAFRTTEGLLSRAAVALGRSFSNIMNTLLPGKQNAAIVLVANERTRKALPSGLHGRVEEMCENAVDLNQWVPSTPAQSSVVPGRFIFIGRLIDWKAIDVLLEALVSVPGATLEILGDGPMLGPWQVLAAKLGVAERVTFAGWCSQRECAKRLASGACLVLPSLYECGGAVILEAMAMCRPVIATKWGGPADYLDESCGILIDPISRKAMVDGFATAMQRLLESPDLCLELGSAGRERAVRHFDWQCRVDQIVAHYRSVAAVREVSR